MDGRGLARLAREAREAQKAYFRERRKGLPGKEELARSIALERDLDAAIAETLADGNTIPVPSRLLGDSEVGRAIQWASDYMLLDTLRDHGQMMGAYRAWEEDSRKKGRGGIQGHETEV